MRKKIFSLLTFLTILSAILILTDTSYAQRRRTRRVSYSKAQVEQVLRRIEEKTDRFVKVFDESLDDSRLNGSRAEDNFTDRARKLEAETDELRREFNRRDSYAENAPNVRSVLNTATDVDRIMRSRNFGRQSESLWLNLRNDLNLLARIYRLPAVGSGTYRVVTTRNSVYLPSRGTVNSKQRIEDLLKRIEEKTDAFTKSFDESLDDSRLNGSRAEDNLTVRTKDLENATDRLRREFDHSDTRGETAVNARRVLNSATIVDRIMKRRNYGRETESRWINLRSELNTLAGIYRLSAVGARSYR